MTAAHHMTSSTVRERLHDYRRGLPTEPDSSDSSDTPSDCRYDVNETRHKDPSDTYSAPTGPAPDWHPDTHAQACSQYWQGVFAASLSTRYIGNWPERDTVGTDSSAQEGVPATDALVREIRRQAAADDEVDEFVRAIWGDRLLSWAGSVRWTARLPFGASLAAAPFVFRHGISHSAGTPCIPPRRIMPIQNVVSRTSHTETTKGGDPPKVDKDGARKIEEIATQELTRLTRVTTLELAELVLEGDTTGGVTREELRQADITFCAHMQGPRATAAAVDTRLADILELRETHPAMFVHVMAVFAARDAPIARAEQAIADQDQQITDQEGPWIELAVCDDEIDNRRTACMARVGQSRGDDADDDDDDTTAEMARGIVMNVYPFTDALLHMSERVFSTSK